MVNEVYSQSLMFCSALLLVALLGFFLAKYAYKLKIQ